MAQRIQRKRVKGWRMPENTVSVTRPGRFRNPYKIGAEYEDDHGRLGEITLENCLRFFRLYVQTILTNDPDWLEPLRGKDLACWCPVGSPCHADILLELANR